MVSRGLSRQAAARGQRSRAPGRPEGVDGAEIAAQFMRLGRLGLKEGEDLVIEVDEVDPDRAAAARREEPQARPGAAEEDCSRSPLVEEDLVVSELSSDDEALARLPPLEPVLGAWRNRGRRLMAARAQTCVVCMEEKEHTLVPPHRKVEGTQVEGHRFCTDCWAGFLQHSMFQQQRAAASKAGLVPAPLACPMCRGTIDVPDVWALGLDLPASWRPPSPTTSAGSGISRLAEAAHGRGGPWSFGRGAREEAFWADAARPGAARPGSGGSGSSSSSRASVDVCAARRAAAAADDFEDDDGNASRSQPVSKWLALACPMACCFKRLQRAMAQDTTTHVEEIVVVGVRFE